MKKKIQGAWLIHHCKKLQKVQDLAGQYEQINFAGKCGTLLSSFAASEEMIISSERANALATAAGIAKRLELPTIINELKRQKLIDCSGKDIHILGLSTEDTLKHTATIFRELDPSSREIASLDVAEMSSECPIAEKNIQEEISDTYQISEAETKHITSQYVDVGFVDSQKIGNNNLLFNGNLFRKENLSKIQGVLSSLSSVEEHKVRELLQTLDTSGCITIEIASAITGNDLLQKIISIGFIDVNTIGNELGNHYFVTRPTAFKKYSSAIIEDAFDLAKAFVSSLTYGMTSSAYGRGKITMIEALMRKLINGSWVGPATAIGQDYNILELKGVIQLRAEGGMFSMKLLKKDVGEIAYKVISEGEVSSSLITQLPSISATTFSGPETNRTITRKRQSATVSSGVASLLNDLRTGGLR